jgi:hypothetical protein
MTPAIKKSAIIAILLACGITLRGQTDSLAVDSVTARIMEILKEYNSYTIFVDTSEYVQYDFNADDINLQTAASLGHAMRLSGCMSGERCKQFCQVVWRGPFIMQFNIRQMGGQWRYCCLGADPDLDDIYGNTPLITAVRA